MEERQRPARGSSGYRRACLDCRRQEHPHLPRPLSLSCPDPLPCPRRVRGDLGEGEGRWGLLRPHILPTSKVPEPGAMARRLRVHSPTVSGSLRGAEPAGRGLGHPHTTAHAVQLLSFSSLVRAPCWDSTSGAGVKPKEVPALEGPAEPGRRPTGKKTPGTRTVLGQLAAQVWACQPGCRPVHPPSHLVS